MSNVSEWSTSAASNNAAPPDGWPEDMRASTVNDSARENMAALARWYQDTNGSLESGGSSNAYTLTTNNGFTNLGDLCPLVFIANHSNTAGTATLKVDALIAKNLRVGGSTTLVADQIIADVAYMVIYNATDDVFDVIGAFTNDASKLTQGTLADARLSSNVPLKDANNTFTGVQIISSTSPQRVYIETDAAPDNKRWGVDVFNEAFFIRAINDADSDLRVALQIERTGITIDSIALNGTTLDLNGNIDADGTDCDLTFTTIDLNGAVEVDGVTFIGAFTASNATAGEPGYLGVPRVSVTTDTTIAAAHSGKELVLSSAADDITVQASGAPVEGMAVFLDNQTGGAVNILQGAGMTLTLDGTSTTGNRTLAANGRAYIRFTSSSTASVGGPGVS